MTADDRRSSQRGTMADAASSRASPHLDPVTGGVARAAADWVRRRTDDVVQAIVDRIAVDVPGYRSPAGDVLPQVHEHATQLAALFRVVLAQQRRLDDDERAIVAAVGAQRADDGLDLASVHQAVHAAMAVAQEAVLEAARALGGDTWRTARLLLAALHDYEFDLLTAIADGYHRQRESAVEATLRDREGALRTLLEHPGGSTRLGRGDLPVLVDPVGVVVALPFRGAAGFSRRVGELADALPGCLHPPLLFGDPSAHAVLLVPAADETRWDGVLEVADATSRRLRLCLLGGRAAERFQLSAAYEALRRLVPFAPATGRAGVVDPAEVSPYRLVSCAPSEEQLAFVEAVLGPVLVLPPARSDALLDTLRARYQSPTASGAAVAERVHVHVKTVRYRLRRIEELTGLGVDTDRFRLELALRLLDAHRTGLVRRGRGRW